MKLNRRDVLQGACATGLTMTAFPRLAHASLALGSKTIHALSDGSISLPANLIFDPVPEGDRAPFLARHAIGETVSPPCNLTLLQDGDRTILFDVGAGPEFQSSAGFILDALDEIGLTQDDITDVVFTHAHPDHLWGLLDDFDDLTFPDANYHIGQKEWDYWTDPATVDTIGEFRTTFAVGAARRLERIADRVMLIDAGQEVLPGVVAHETFGHTPGHLAFEIGDTSGSVMVLGDCIANHHAAFEMPQWPSGSDQDQDTALATRVRLLDQLAADKTQIVGFHLPGNGLGAVSRNGAGYRFEPDA